MIVVQVTEALKRHQAMQMAHSLVDLFVPFLLRVSLGATRRREWCVVRLPFKHEEVPETHSVICQRQQLVKVK